MLFFKRGCNPSFLLYKKKECRKSRLLKGCMSFLFGFMIFQGVWAGEIECESCGDSYDDQLNECPKCEKNKFSVSSVASKETDKDDLTPQDKNEPPPVPTSPLPSGGSPGQLNSVANVIEDEDSKPSEGTLTTSEIHTDTAYDNASTASGKSEATIIRQTSNASTSSVKPPPPADFADSSDQVQVVNQDEAAFINDVEESTESLKTGQKTSNLSRSSSKGERNKTAQVKTGDLTSPQDENSGTAGSTSVINERVNTEAVDTSDFSSSTPKAPKRTRNQSVSEGESLVEPSQQVDQDKPALQSQASIVEDHENGQKTSPAVTSKSGQVVASAGIIKKEESVNSVGVHQTPHPPSAPRSKSTAHSRNPSIASLKSNTSHRSSADQKPSTSGTTVTAKLKGGDNKTEARKPQAKNSKHTTLTSMGRQGSNVSDRSGKRVPSASTNGNPSSTLSSLSSSRITMQSTALNPDNKKLKEPNRAKKAIVGGYVTKKEFVDAYDKNINDVKEIAGKVNHLTEKMDEMSGELSRLNHEKDREKQILLGPGVDLERWSELNPELKLVLAGDDKTEVVITSLKGPDSEDKRVVKDAVFGMDIILKNSDCLILSRESERSIRVSPSLDDEEKIYVTFQKWIDLNGLVIPEGTEANVAIDLSVRGEGAECVVRLHEKNQKGLGRFYQERSFGSGVSKKRQTKVALSVDSRYLLVEWEAKLTKDSYMILNSPWFDENIIPALQQQKYYYQSLAFLKKVEHVDNLSQEGEGEKTMEDTVKTQMEKAKISMELGKFANDDGFLKGEKLFLVDPDTRERLKKDEQGFEFIEIKDEHVFYKMENLKKNAVLVLDCLDRDYAIPEQEIEEE